MAAYPTIIPNHHRSRVLNVFSPTLYFRLMRRCHNGHVGPKHDRISYRDQATIEDRKVEVAVEALADADIAAVIHAERRLDEYLIAFDMA